MFPDISWTCSNIPTSLLYWGAHDSTQFFRWALITAELTGNYHLPPSAVDILTNAPRLLFLPHCWLTFSLSTRTPRSSSAKLFSSHLAPICSGAWGCPSSHARLSTSFCYFVRSVLFSSLPIPLWHSLLAYQLVQFYIVYKPAKGTLCPISQVINEDVTRYWPQYWLLGPAWWSLMTCLQVDFVSLVQPLRPTHSVFNLPCCPLIWPVFNELLFEDVIKTASKALIKLR